MKFRLIKIEIILSIFLVLQIINAQSPTPNITPTNTPIPNIDICPGIVINNLPFSINSSTVGYNNDYDPGAGGCAGGLQQQGNDVVFTVNLSMPAMLRAVITPESGFDVSIYVVTDCQSIATTCITGSDLGGSGESETVEFQVNGGQDYYIICDSQGGSGSFYLEIYEISPTNTPIYSPTVTNTAIPPTNTPTSSPIPPTLTPTTTPIPPTFSPIPSITPTTLPLMNVWHIPINEEPPTVTMRNPLYPDVNVNPVYIYCGGYPQGTIWSGELYYRKLGSTSWNISEFNFDSNNGNNEYFVAQLINNFNAGDTIEYYLRMTGDPSIFSVTYVYGDDNNSYTTNNESIAISNTYKFTLPGGTPSATPPPPTNTPILPSPTPQSSTQTPVPPTNTPTQITNTPLPPTSTPLPPTNTPIQPTNTPTVPSNDVCPGESITLPYSGTGTTLGANNDYDPGAGGCASGIAQPGSDVVYRVNLPYNSEIVVQVQPEPGFDCSVYVVTNCDDVVTTCIAGSDQGGAGSGESVQFFIAGTYDYYIIVDSSDLLNSGSFSIEVYEIVPTSSPSPVSTETPLPTSTNTPAPPTATNTPTLVPTSTPTEIPTILPIVVNEVYYNPIGIEPDEEWVEIYNKSPNTSVSLDNIKIGDEETQGGTEGMYEFPPGYQIAPLSFIVIANRADSFYTLYGFYPDFELNDTVSSIPDLTKYTAWSTGDMSLSNSGDQVLLLSQNDQVVDVVVYGNATYPGVIPHPGVNEGSSIERCPAGRDTNDCSSDMIEVLNGGTPGDFCPVFTPTATLTPVPPTLTPTPTNIPPTFTPSGTLTPTNVPSPSPCAGSDQCDPGQVISNLPFYATDNYNCFSNDYDPGETNCNMSNNQIGPDGVYHINMTLSEPIIGRITLTPIDSVDVSVYVVTNCDQIPTSCVAGVDDFGVGEPETVDFTIENQVDYYIIVDSSQEITEGSYDISIEEISLLPNDRCPGYDIPSLPYSTSDSTSEAYNDYDPESGGCATGWPQAGPDVVYHYFTDVDKVIQVTMIPESTYDCSIYVVTDCNDIVGSCVVGADDNYYGVAETITFTATANVDYYIICDGYYETGGNFDLLVEEIIPTITPTSTIETPTPAITNTPTQIPTATSTPQLSPTPNISPTQAPTSTPIPTSTPTRVPNDVCPGFTIETLPYTNDDSTIDATNDYDPGNNGCAGGWQQQGPDVVYNLTVQENKYIQAIILPESTYDASLYVITDCDNPVESCVVGSDMNLEGGQESVIFYAEANITYYIICDGFWQTGGNFTLSVIEVFPTPTPPPPTTTPTIPPTPTITPTQLPPTLTPTIIPPTPTTLPPSPTQIPPTLTPTPTFTQIPPTYTPPPPTLTPTPTYKLGVELEMPSNYFKPGQTCYLKVIVSNPGPVQYNLNLFVFLDINTGDFWFFPTWKHYPPDFDYIPIQMLPIDRIVFYAIEPFTWPQNAGSYDSCRFWGALTDANMTKIVGQYSFWQFGYGY